LPTSHSHIARIGVTGGIGSGKSEVCAAFQKLGVPILYADDIARELSDRRPDLKRAILKLLGPDAYTAEGTLNRPYVASRVFSNRTLQRKLNALVHPEVEREVRRTVQGYAGRFPFVMIEAALIYEAGLDDSLDAVVVVDAPETVRLQRVVQRDRTRPQDVRKRMRAQWSQQKKVQRADYVVINDGTLQSLQAQVRFLYNLFLQRYR
jgi:dephospho-CoA kinase